VLNIETVSGSIHLTAYWTKRTANIVIAIANKNMTIQNFRGKCHSSDLVAVPNANSTTELIVMNKTAYCIGGMNLKFDFPNLIR
jgi:hypothetical protein